jgi:integrase
MQPDRPRPKPFKIKDESFVLVIRAFMESEKFTDLAPATQTSYRHMLKFAALPEVLGARSVYDLRPALIQAFIDGIASHGQRNIALTALKSMEKWAIVRDKLPHTITMGVEAPTLEGGHTPWTDAQVELGEREARPQLSRVITLAANTGQRGSDLVKARWSDLEDYDGRPGINVVQQKTGLKLWIPLTQELQAAMMKWERRPTYILLKDDGQPWTRANLSDQWLRERATNPALCDILKARLVLHGLRGTAVVRLRRAGLPTPLICDMVGMSPAMVARYCRFSVQRENAMAAIHFLDRTTIERARAKKLADR